MTQPGILAFIILGLLNEKPMSGYDVRRLFRDTPLKSYSDSPGATYPALRSLETRKFVQGRTDASTPLRPKRVFRVTPAGRDALIRWLRAPVRAVENSRHAGEFEAKLAFMSELLSREETIALTREYASAVREHLHVVRAYEAEQEANLSLSARLALNGGVVRLEATLKWLEEASRRLRTK
jgi:DNA-binding PadR family transcriptional regulator